MAQHSAAFMGLVHSRIHKSRKVGMAKIGIEWGMVCPGCGVQSECRVLVPPRDHLEGVYAIHAARSEQCGQSLACVCITHMAHNKYSI